MKHLAVAQGLTLADLVLKNARVVNVFTNEILAADIALCGATIVGVGSYSGQTEIDMAGQFVCPGFIDAHLHLESALVTPAEVIQAALRWGTTTFIVDPHEAANVAGPLGIDYILDQTQDVPANVYLMLPSCVPATPFEDNGFDFGPEHMKAYLNNPRVLGLGEVMDYNAVLAGEASMMDKLNLFRHKVIDGHAPGLSDPQLAAYRLAGITSDHESTDFESSLRERRLGMQVLIREGSAARNLEAIVTGVVETGIDASGFSFCTDDKHIEDIHNEGHISHNVKRAIALGLNSIEAVKMATLNTARFYGLRHLGAIAPGYQADMVVCSDLDSLDITEVYHKGVKVNPASIQKPSAPPNELLNTVRVAAGFDNRLAADISLTGDNQCPAIEMIPGQIITRCVPVEQVVALQAEGTKFNKVAVIERHKATGKVGQALVLGFNLTGGALAATVAHDSHNLIVIGDNDADMILAAEEVIRLQGGYVLVGSGRIVDSLPLPVMGLLSDAGFEEVNSSVGRITETLHRMGVPANIDPLVNLSFISLPVIPDIRVTTRGLYDVVGGKFLTP